MDQSLQRSYLKHMRLRHVVPDIEFKVLEDSPGAMITFKGIEAHNTTTIFGGKAGEAIHLKPFDIDRLPHNLIHALFTDIPQGKMIYGKTPDIVFPDGTFWEIATSRSTDEKDILNALVQKRTKYASLGIEFGVVVVGPFTVLSQPDFLTQMDKGFLSEVLTLGHKLQDEFYKVKGNPRSSRIFAIPWEKKDFVCDFKSIPKVSELQPDYPDLDIQKYFTERTSFSVYVHTPLFIADEEDAELPGFDTSNPYYELVRHIAKMKGMEHRDLAYLNVISKSGKTPKVFDDQFRLSKTFTRNLKIKGLGAKRMRGLEVQSHYEHSKVPYNLNLDHGRLESYLNSPDDLLPTSCFKTIESKIRGSNLASVCKAYGAESLIYAADCLDLALREISLNAKRYTPDNTFIYRKVPNRPIYVMLKSTGYNKVGDDRPIFYFIVYKGRPYEPGIYENHTKLCDGWYCTEFNSTDKRRLEHLIGLSEQLISHKYALSKDLGDQPEVLNRSFKILSLILISNSSKVSETCQVLRYYYMKLYSGMPTHQALSSLSKWPDTIRSPLQSYIMSFILRHHPSKPLKFELKLPADVDLADDDKEPAEANVFVDLLDRQDHMTSFPTPFGFDIKSGKSFLRASYMCMLYNKNRQNLGHDSKLIFQKLLKNEILFHKQGLPILVDLKQASDYKRFQASPSAIRHYSYKLLRRLATKTNNDVMQVKGNALEFLLKDDMYDLLSTKSSSTASGDVFNKDDYDVRSKVFIELMKLSDSDGLEPNLMDNLPLLKSKWSEFATVSLFKKNQIGGVREIYILDILSRLRIRILESLSRGFCLQSDNEMLTHPGLKSGFTARHSQKCSMEFQGEAYRTLRYSGDMTNWANLLMMEYFEVMFSVLMPEHFGLISDILDINRKKRIYAPEALLNSFNKRPETKLLDESVQAFKSAYLGFSTEPFAEEGRPYVTNVTNMMQGILHYTSSLYHLVHMEMLTEKLEKNISLITNSKVVISHEVSSDDEGMLISFKCPDLKGKAKRIIQTFWACKLSVDNIFGVRTSLEKSTLSIQSIYEFNSTFHFMNNVVMPNIKFVARAIDDNPAETLRQRVASLHSNLRQMREAGCDGETTHVASLCQLSLFSKNMGAWVMAWDTKDSPYWKSKLSTFGAYYVHPPWTSGLVSCDYDDWLECMRDEKLLNLYIRHSIKDVLVEEQFGHSLTYRLWPRKKYDLMLKQFGLNPDKSSLGIDRVYLTKWAKDKTDVKKLFSNYATDPGIAKSFSWLTRNECVQMSAFAQWGLRFDGESYYDLLNGQADDSNPVKLDICFPESSQYSRFYDIECTEFKSVKMDRDKAQSYHMFYPIAEKDKIVFYWKKSLDHLWFGTNYGQMNMELEALSDQLKALIPWLRDKPEDSLLNSPFENYVQMIMFFDAVLKKYRPMTLLCSGRYPTVSPIEALIRYNTKSGYRTYAIGVSLDTEAEIKAMIDVESRFSLWSDILRVLDKTSAPEVLSKMKHDIHLMLQDQDPDVLKSSLRTGSLRQRCFMFSLMASLSIIDFETFMSEYPSDLHVYLEPQRFINDSWSGTGDVYFKAAGHICRMKLIGDNVVELISRQPPTFWEKYVYKAKHKFKENYRYICADVDIKNADMDLVYVSGFRVKVGNGYTQRFGLDAYPRFNDHDVPFQCSPYKSINKYFKSRMLEIEDVKALNDADDLIAESLCRLIKELRLNQIPVRLRERLMTLDQKMDDIPYSMEEILENLYAEDDELDAEAALAWEQNFDDVFNMLDMAEMLHEPYVQSGSYNPTLQAAVQHANNLVRLNQGSRFVIDTDPASSAPEQAPEAWNKKFKKISIKLR